MNYDIFHKNTSKQTKLISERNFTYRIIISVINKYLSHEKVKNILDIGCGAGTLGLYYASKGHSVLGIDISKKAVNEANKSAKYLHLNTITFEQMDFPSEIPHKKFDFIIFTEVIEHLSNDDEALKKIYNLLNKNGLVILSTPSVHAPLHKLGLTKEFDKNVGHLRRYDIEELKNKARGIGFRIVAEKKTEGIIRNFLFINPVAGKFVRFVRYFVADIVTFVDNNTIPVFGESNFFLVMRK